MTIPRNEERLYQILEAPVVTEKATRVAESNNQAVFHVCPTATKKEIKDAVEFLFSVNVLNVQVLTVKGKAKRSSRGTGQRSDWKKAYITLAKDQEISLVGE